MWDFGSSSDVVCTLAKRISFRVLVSWPVCNGEVVASEEFRPSDLPSVEGLGGGKVSQVLMVCVDGDRVL